MYNQKNVSSTTTKELFGLRPCSVNGRKAWFHCWIQTEHPYFINTGFYSAKEAKEIFHEIENMTIIPPSFKVEKIARVVAIVDTDLTIGAQYINDLAEDIAAASRMKFKIFKRKR